MSEPHQYKPVILYPSCHELWSQIKKEVREYHALGNDGHIIGNVNDALNGMLAAMLKAKEIQAYEKKRQGISKPHVR
jgi:hypothetical protein